MSRTDRLVELDIDTCYRHLGEHEIGRLAVVDGNTPLIFPVNYAVAGDRSIIIRTVAGTKLDLAKRAPVAFEVDQVDERTHMGWSVVVHGHADEVTRYDGDRMDSTEAIPLEPWAGGDRRHLLRIVASSVTGRRLAPVGEE